MLSEDELLSTGEKYSKWFYSSELDSLIHFILDSNYKLSDLKKFRQKVEKQLGSELQTLNVQYGIETWQNYYIKYSVFKKSAQPVRTLFTFDNRKRIIQFSVQALPKEASTRFGNYLCKTKLSLPFKGEWLVAWGGRKINENQHAVSSPQRFAYDFLIRKECKTFDGDGLSNFNYYCYEKEVVAPGSGKIVEIVNDVADNPIGEMPQIHGNRVVIDHGNGEFSILAHFKQRSITVKVGDTIESGQLLGLCGNSGHSSEPHIHYHLQNSPDIDNGEGFPIQFQVYFSNGKEVKLSEPKIGEMVQNIAE